jgi:dTDP-glucose 4,6-dehydratase
LLVTGGAGFIGTNFCHYWSERHPEDVLVVLDALTYAGNADNLAGLIERGRISWVHGDIGDFERVVCLLRDESIDTVVNVAAETHVDRSIENPGIFLQTNAMGTQVLLEACRKVWMQARTDRAVRFHQISTDEVYGTLGPQDAAFTEQSHYAPRSPYAASKAAADHLVQAYFHTYGLPCTISLACNNFGPYQFPEKLIPLCVLNVLEGRTLPVYGDGLQVRDWTHVEDHCRAIDLLLQGSAPGTRWNVGANAEQTNLDLVRAICRTIDALFSSDESLRQRFPRCPAARGEQSQTLIEHVRDRPGHDRRYALNCQRIAEALGYCSTRPFEESLAQTVRWYLDNEAWWRRCLRGEHAGWLTRQYGRLVATAESAPS